MNRVQQTWQIESKREHSILLIIIGNLSRNRFIGTLRSENFLEEISKIFFLSAYART